MAAPLLLLYVGLLAILSIFFYKNVDPDYQKLEGTVHNWIKTITAKVEDIDCHELNNHVTSVTDGIKDLAGSMKDKLINPLAHDGAVAANSAVDSAAGVVSKTKITLVKAIESSVVYKYVNIVYSTIEEYINDYFTAHPKFASKVYTSFKCVYGFIKSKYAEAEKIFKTIIDQEPLKSVLIKLGLIHTNHVSPLVEKATDFFGPYVSKAYDFVKFELAKEEKQQTIYTFLVFAFGIVFCKYALTSFLRLVAADAFQMNKNITDMYKLQQQEKVDGLITSSDAQHSDVYLKMKGDTSESAMTIDELNELEKEYDSASNRTRSNEGSNRTRSEEVQKEEEQAEIDDGQQHDLKMVDEEVIVTSPSPAPHSSPSASTDSSEGNAPQKNKRLVYDSSRSAVSEFDTSIGTIDSSQLSAAAVSGVTKTSENTPPAPNTGVSGGSSARSVRSLLSVE